MQTESFACGLQCCLHTCPQNQTSTSKLWLGQLRRIPLHWCQRVATNMIDETNTVSLMVCMMPHPISMRDGSFVAATHVCHWLLYTRPACCLVLLHAPLLLSHLLFQLLVRLLLRSKTAEILSSSRLKFSVQCSTGGVRQDIGREGQTSACMELAAESDAFSCTSTWHQTASCNKNSTNCEYSTVLGVVGSDSPPSLPLARNTYKADTSEPGACGCCHLAYPTLTSWVFGKSVGSHTLCALDAATATR